MLKTFRTGAGRPYLPDLLAALGFFAIAALLMSGLVIPLNDLLFRGDMAGYYGYEYALRSGLAQGHLPLWNMYTSTSIVADPQSEMFYPVMALLRWVPLPYLFIWTFLLHDWMAGLGMYAVVRVLGGRRPAAILAGVAYMLSGVVIARMSAGHVTLVHGLPWAAWLFVVFHRLLERRTWPWFFLTVLCIVCFVLTGHPQWVLFGMLPSIALGLMTLIEAALAHPQRGLAHKFRRMWHIAGWSAGAAFLSGLILAVYLLPIAQFVALTGRSRRAEDPAASTSLNAVGSLRLPMLVTPLAYIEAVTGPQDLHEVMAYTGMLTLGLALLACFPPEAERRRMRWLLAGLAIFGVVASLGPPALLYQLIHVLIPLIRVPGRFLLIWAFASAALAGLGLDDLLRRQEAGRPAPVWPLWLGLAIVLGTLLWMLAADVAGPPFGEALVEGVKRLGIWPTYQLAGAALLMCAALLIARRWVPPKVWQWLAVAAMFLDVGGAAVQQAVWRLDPSDYLNAYFEQPNPYLGLRVDPARVRLWGVLPSEPVLLAPTFGIPVIARDPQGAPSYINQVAKLKDRGQALSGSGFGILVAPKHPEKFPVIAQSGSLYLLEAAGNVPRVYATSAARPVRTPDDSLAAVADPAFDPLRLTIVDDPDGRFAGLPDTPGNPLARQPVFVTYSPDRIVIQVSADRPLMVVVPDPFYPGWSAAVDGHDAPIWQVNHAFRGVQTPAGDHTVVMTYLPESFSIGLAISAASLALSLAAALWLTFRKRMADGE